MKAFDTTKIQVKKVKSVIKIIEETENYQMVQEIMDEILVDAFGITDEESAAESRKRGTIGFLFEKLKDAQVKEKPVATKGVENKRMEKEKEKTVEEVAVDGANETIASLKSALGIVELAISKLGTTQDVPTLTGSDERSSDNSDVASSNEEEARGARSKHGKNKKLQKRKSKKKNKETHKQKYLNFF